MKLTRLQLPRMVRDLGSTTIAAPPSAAPKQAVVVCRTVTLHADFDRLAADLERELRVALDGEIVALVAGRIRR